MDELEENLDPSESEASEGESDTDEDLVDDEDFSDGEEEGPSSGTDPVQEEEDDEQLEESETQENFDESMKDTASKRTSEYVYAKIPSVSSEKFIIDHKICNKQISFWLRGRDLEYEFKNFKHFKKCMITNINMKTQCHHFRSSNTTLWNPQPKTNNLTH